MWIKGNEKIDGSHLTWKDKQGNEFETWNPTDEFLTEQGWVKEEEEEPVDEGPSLREVKDQVIQELNEFYRSVVLKAEFHDELVWIPFETRQAYRQILQDVSEEGFDWVEYRNNKIQVKDAISALKAMNVYEFKCREIRDKHIKNVIQGLSKDFVEMYDYTSNYPENLKLN